MGPPLAAGMRSTIPSAEISSDDPAEPDVDVEVDRTLPSWAPEGLNHSVGSDASGGSTHPRIRLRRQPCQPATPCLRRVGRTCLRAPAPERASAKVRRNRRRSTAGGPNLMSRRPRFECMVPSAARTIPAQKSGGMEVRRIGLGMDTPRRGRRFGYPSRRAVACSPRTRESRDGRTGGSARGRRQRARASRHRRP